MPFTTRVLYLLFLSLGSLAATLGCSGSGDDQFWNGTAGGAGDGGAGGHIQKGGSGGSGQAGKAGSGKAGGAGHGAAAGSANGGSGGTSMAGSGGSAQGGADQGGSGGTPSTGGAPATGGTGAQGGSPGCYAEVYHPEVAIDDLQASYSGGNWLSISLQVLERRYPTGWFVLNAEKNDYQLPNFVDNSSWGAFVTSIDTMVHEESHGWDFDNSTYGSHNYVLRDDLQLQVPELSTWPRSDILQYITGNTTQMYDDVYLTGEQGTYDAIFQMDEMNAYANGLATLASVHEHVPPSISSRDGAAAMTYHLELYLKAGRNNHPTQYAALKANADWQKLVRYEWARVHFWDNEAKPYSNLTIEADAIWTLINQPSNLDEIEQFTGEDPASVACHP